MPAAEAYAEGAGDYAETAGAEDTGSSEAEADTGSVSGTALKGSTVRILSERQGSEEATIAIVKSMQKTIFFMRKPSP